MREKRCINCMKTIPEGLQVCPHCGFVNEQYQAEPYALPAGYSLQEGRYRLGRVTEERGSAITYIGWDTRFEQIVTIQEFFPKSMVGRESGQSCSIRLYKEKDPTAINTYLTAITRVEQKARLMRRFQEVPGLVRVYDFFTENNTIYMVLEHVEGQTLRKFCEDGQTLDVRQFEPLIRSLDQIHEEGVLHRDLSMDTILIRDDGSLKMLDFGIEQPQEEDMESVTVKYGYAPLEQYAPNEENQGPWVDVYALCVCIWNALSGETFADSRERSEGAVSKGGKGFPRKVREALQQGLELNYRDRIQNMSELYFCLYGIWPETPKTNNKSNQKRKRRET